MQTRLSVHQFNLQSLKLIQLCPSLFFSSISAIHVMPLKPTHEFLHPSQMHKILAFAHNVINLVILLLYCLKFLYMNIILESTVYITVYFLECETRINSTPSHSHMRTYLHVYLFSQEWYTNRSGLWYITGLYIFWICNSISFWNLSC